MSILFVSFDRISNANEQTKFADTIAKNIIEQRIVSDEFLLYRESRTIQQWNLKQQEIQVLLLEADSKENLSISPFLETLKRIMIWLILDVN
mgnify:CR=1 FL=1